MNESSQDKFYLSRFIDAQNGIYESVLKELKQGKKRSHWMWFIFPQIDGLGTSYTSKQYSIKSIEEAREYLKHPILGSRLVECATIVSGINNVSAKHIFGFPDFLKFHSSMALFSVVTMDQQIFRKTLEKFYNGEPDKKTLAILGITDLNLPGEGFA